jgi:hypothetical protein
MMMMMLITINNHAIRYERLPEKNRTGIDCTHHIYSPLYVDALLRRFSDLLRSPDFVMPPPPMRD